MSTILQPHVHYKRKLNAASTKFRIMQKDDEKFGRKAYNSLKKCINFGTPYRNHFDLLLEIDNELKIAYCLELPPNCPSQM